MAHCQRYVRRIVDGDCHSTVLTANDIESQKKKLSRQPRAPEELFRHHVHQLRNLSHCYDDNFEIDLETPSINNIPSYLSIFRVLL